MLRTKCNVGIDLPCKNSQIIIEPISEKNNALCGLQNTLGKRRIVILEVRVRYCRTELDIMWVWVCDIILKHKTWPFILRKFFSCHSKMWKKKSSKLCQLKHYCQPWVWVFSWQLNKNKAKEKKNTQKAPMLLGVKFGVMEIQSFVWNLINWAYCN